MTERPPEMPHTPEEAREPRGRWHPGEHRPWHPILGHCDCLKCAGSLPREEGAPRPLLMSDNGFPRRIRRDLYTPAEQAISAAVTAVEAVGADVRLTNAVIKLGEAQRDVADYIDDAIRAGKMPMPESRASVSPGGAAPPEVPEAESLIGLIRLAAMDGYNKEPVSTVDEWVAEAKKWVFLVYLAGRDSAVASSSGLGEAPPRQQQQCPDCGSAILQPSKVDGYTYCTRCGRGSIPYQPSEEVMSSERTGCEQSDVPQAELPMQTVFAPANDAGRVSDTALGAGQPNVREDAN
jgi:hypothetical protein